MEKVLLYIHGKDGSADEANRYKDIFADYDVIGLDYKGTTPWYVKDEFIKAYQELSKRYKSISILANSIGAYFAMNALSGAKIDRAFFVSPIVDMEKLILQMMDWSDITEKELEERKEIATYYGETLSWKYLCYARKHRIEWNVPTDVLYGENDNLTSLETISLFVRSHKATLSVMKNGEHWFHTKEQMNFLDNWLKQCLNIV